MIRLLLLATLLLTSACARGGSDLTGAIKAEGSSTVAPLTSAVVGAFVKRNPDVQIAVSATASIERLGAEHVDRRAEETVGAGCGGTRHALGRRPRRLARQADFTDGDLGSDVLAFVPARSSPTGRPMLIVGHEVSGSTSFYDVNVR